MNAPRTEAPRAAARPKNPMKRRPTSNGETSAPLDVAPSPAPEQPVPFGSGFWTHHAKEPAVERPWTAEIAVHVKVAMPVPRRIMPTDTVPPATQQVTGGTLDPVTVASVTPILTAPALTTARNAM